MVALKRSNLAILFAVLLIMPLGAASTVHEGVLGLYSPGKFPLLQSIGQLEDPSRPSHPAVSSVHTALNDFYRPDWFERYVQPTSIFALSRMHDKRLATTLPATIAIGMAKVRAKQVFLPVAILDAEGTYTVWDLILTEDAEGDWLIHSITIP